MTVALLVVVILLALSLTGLAVVAPQVPASARHAASGRRRAAHPVPVHRQRALAARARRLAAPGRAPRTRRWSRCSSPGCPLQLPLDTPLPRQSNIAIPLQEAIERRATKFGIAVDARIERGRTYRHALRQTMAHERFDRIVIAAAARNNPGFGPEDIAWILENAPGEILVLRPDREEVLTRARPRSWARPRAAGGGPARAWFGHAPPG